MKLLYLVYLTAQALHSVDAASACKKDQCYNQIAVQGSSNPKAAVRRADCSAVLKRVVDDDFKLQQTSFIATSSITTTIFLTSSRTGTSLTTKSTTITDTTNVDGTSTLTANRETKTVTTTVTSSATTVTLRKRVQTDQAGNFVRAQTTTPVLLEDLDSTFALEERDKIVVSGFKPTYASACAGVQEFAVGCLCWGIQPAQVRTITKTVVTTGTSSIRTTQTSYVATSSLTTLSTSTSVITTVKTLLSVTTTLTPTTTSTTTALQAPTVITKMISSLSSRILAGDGDVQLSSDPSPSIPFRIQLKEPNTPPIGVTDPDDFLAFDGFEGTFGLTEATDATAFLCFINENRELKCTPEGGSGIPQQFKECVGDTTLRVFAPGSTVANCEDTEILVPPFP